MFEKLKPAAVAALLFFAAACYGQLPSKDLVKGKAVLSHDKLLQGGRFEAAVVLDIKPGYHIYASDDSAPYPTTLQIGPVKGIEFDSPKWPKPKRMAALDEKVSGYEGRVVIRVAGKVSKTAKTGSIAVPFTVKMLPCGEKACSAPLELKLNAQGTIAPPKAKAKPINREFFPGIKASSSDKSGGEAPQNRGLLGNVIARYGMLPGFIAVFFMGIGLAFFPCVYPLIPITAAFFASQKDKQNPLGLCIAYVLGIAATYSAIGGAAAAVGGLLGSALRYPAVLASVSAVIVLLALSMFGLYQIRMPSFLADKASARSGYLGALAMGLLMGVIAAPCGAGLVAPIISLAAASQSIALGIAIFFVFSLGLGLPYMVLGLSSHALANAPMAGPWMVTLERVFAFLLLGVSLYIISPLLPETVFRALMAAIIAALGIYLASCLLTKDKKPLRAAIGLAILATGIAYSPWVSAPESSPAEQIDWVAYSPDTLERAASQGKPVMIDFTAEWCFYCKKLEQKTFPDPKVAKLSKSFVNVKADLTKQGVSELEELRKSFGVSSLPTIVFLDRNGKEIKDLRISDYVEPDTLAKSMNAVLQQ